MRNLWPNANKTGAAAKPAEDQPKAERKRSQAPALRILPAPLPPVAYFELLQPLEIESAEGVTEGQAGDIVELWPNGRLVVRPRDAYPAEWKFTRRP